MPTQPTTDEDERLDIGAVASALRAARRDNTALAGFPGPLPESLADAYSIQDQSIAAWPDRVAGWKVGGVPEPFRSRFQSDRLAGPIFKRTLRHADFGDRIRMPAYRGGFVAIEAEWAFQIGDLTGFNPATASTAEVARVLKSAHAGVEIASSPMLAINDLGPTAVVSDFGNNFGLIVGPRLDAWSSEALSAIEVCVAINGVRVGAARALPDLAGPLGAARFLIGNLLERGMVDLEGAWVSTGAISGVHDAAIGDWGEVTFAGLGAFQIELVHIGDDGHLV